MVFRHIISCIWNQLFISNWYAITSGVSGDLLECSYYWRGNIRYLIQRSAGCRKLLLRLEEHVICATHVCYRLMKIKHKVQELQPYPSNCRADRFYKAPTIIEGWNHIPVSKTAEAPPSLHKVLCVKCYTATLTHNTTTKSEMSSPGQQHWAFNTIRSTTCKTLEKIFLRDELMLPPPIWTSNEDQNCFFCFHLSL